MLKKLFFIAIIFLLAFGANTVNANETTTVLNETEDVSAYLDVIDINWSLFNPALEVHYWKAVEFYTDDKYKTVSNRLDAMLVIALNEQPATNEGQNFLEILIYWIAWANTQL